MSNAFSDSYLMKLWERFPDTPRSIILKADVLREGLRFTDDLAEVGQWAIPSGAFLSRERVPKDESGDYVLSVPNQMILEDDTRINTELDSNSPYALRKDGDGRYMLYRCEEAVEEVFFSPRPIFSSTMADGAPLAPAIGQRTENCLAITHSLFCEYAKNGEQCSFCFLGNVMAGRNLADLSSSGLPGPTRTIEACALAAKEIEIQHVVVSGGAFVNTSLEAKSYARTISALRDAVGKKTKITAVCQAFDEEGWHLLKEAGTNRVQPNLEVWADTLWPEVVPGKLKALGKQEWIERLEVAVGVFGAGNVGTNFVAGVEAAPWHRFGSLQEALESHLEGYRVLLEKDIVPIFGFLTKPKGTMYENMDLPPTEYYLRLGWERHTLMEEFEMYEHFRGSASADFSCYKCVAHKTCQDYPRLQNAGTA